MKNLKHLEKRIWMAVVILSVGFVAAAFTERAYATVTAYDTAETIIPFELVLPRPTPTPTPTPTPEPTPEEPESEISDSETTETEEAAP